MHYFRKKIIIIGASIATIAFSFKGDASFFIPTFMNPVKVIWTVLEQMTLPERTNKETNQEINHETKEPPVEHLVERLDQFEEPSKRKVHQKVLQYQWVWKEENGQRIQVYMNESGKVQSDASAFLKEDGQILIRIHRKLNRIYVYEMDETGKYSKAIKIMLCSTGKTYTPTKTGEYSLKKVERWHKLNGNVYGQYCCRISEHYLIHSVFYSRNRNPKTLYINEYLKLGQNASHGCVRVTVADAKWIYEHSERIRVLISDENVYFPLEEPVLQNPIRVNGNRGIDPTDQEALASP